MGDIIIFSGVPSSELPLADVWLSWKLNANGGAPNIPLIVARLVSRHFVHAA